MTTETVDLLERDAELDRLRGLAHVTATGHGRVVVIEGPAGIGKTALLDAACAIGSAVGLTISRARGSELEIELAYGVVRQLLERRLEQAASLFASHPKQPAANASNALEIVHRLYLACADVAAQQPLLLAVDDAHWADVESLRFLDYLIRRVNELPVMVALTLRTSDPAARSVWFQRLLLESSLERLAPANLSGSAVAELVERRLGVTTDPAFAGACARATGGNPFLVRELLAAASAGGIAPTPEAAELLLGTAPESVTRSVELRLAALPADATALARAVAVLGGNAGLVQAAALSTLSPSAAGRAADALAAAAILAPSRPLDFVHPLVRAAVYDSLPRAERSDAHARAARLLDAPTTPRARLAEHVMAAEPFGDAWIVDLLRTAAREALTQAAPRSAIRYLRRALDEPPPVALRGSLLRELGQAEQRVGDSAAIDHLREALELSDGAAARASTARALALALLWAERVGDAEAVLDNTVQALASEEPEHAVRLEAEVLSAARLSLSAGLWGAERVERWRGRLRGETPGERLMLANLATQTSLGDFSSAEASELAERAVAHGRLLGEQTADAMPFYQVVYVLTSTDRVDLADDLIDRAAEDARARGSVTGTILASLFGSYTRLGRGDVIGAEGSASLALELASQLDAPPFYLPACVASLVDVLIERDRLGEAEQALLTHGMAGELPDSVPLRLVLFSRGQLRAAQRRWREAADDLLQLGQRQARWQALNPHLVPQDAAAAIALAALGRRAEAEASAQLALTRARRWGTQRALGVAMHAVALAGDDATRIERLHTALDALCASPARLEHARVLVDLGTALRRANQRSRAADALRQALEMASRGGALALAARARQELHALGLRPRRAALTGPQSLTGSERRVADLAASGLTNPQIAQVLFVTVRTVEVHLTHVYQKLGINSRAELPRTASS